jgi:hypothetical protein
VSRKQVTSSASVPGHLPAAVALHSIEEGDVVSDRCAAERATIGRAAKPAKVLVRLVSRR